MAGIPGDLLKEAASAGKAATKGSSRSYMGQLHSGITKAGESMGMSNNVSKYVAGLGMAGAGIGAFNLANGTSENHPFVGGAMKVGILAGGGYAALKGGGAKALEKAVEAGAAKAGAAKAGSGVAKAGVAKAGVANASAGVAKGVAGIKPAEYTGSFHNPMAPMPTKAETHTGSFHNPMAPMPTKAETHTGSFHNPMAPTPMPIGAAGISSVGSPVSPGSVSVGGKTLSSMIWDAGFAA